MNFRAIKKKQIKRKKEKVELYDKISTNNNVLGIIIKILILL